MENRLEPNLRQYDFNPDRDRARGRWKEDEFNDLYPKNKPVLTFDFPKGWGNPWPILLDPEDNHKVYNFNTIKLNNNRKPSENKDLLGYNRSLRLARIQLPIFPLRFFLNYCHWILYVFIIKDFL